MQALDTNILVRFLVKDDEKQADAVFSLIKKAERRREKLFVSLIVLLELIWVLDSLYKVPRDKLLYAISTLLMLPILEIEDRDIVYSFLHEAKNNTYDLDDLLIACKARARGCNQVITFDKKAAQHNLFRLVETSP